MIDPTEMEVCAVRSCLAPLGEYVGTIGMQRSMADYSREEVLALVEVIVSAYQQHMLTEHERMAAKDRVFLEARIARQGQAGYVGAAS